MERYKTVMAPYASRRRAVWVGIHRRRTQYVHPEGGVVAVASNVVVGQPAEHPVIGGDEAAERSGPVHRGGRDRAAASYLASMEVVRGVRNGARRRHRRRVSFDVRAAYVRDGHTV